MTQVVDICNRALQVPGTRTTVTAAELLANNTNEAQQLNLQLAVTRRALLRMAPWNFAFKTANLVYITSTPGTPENESPTTTLWEPGQPAPPWSYEYQYPVDCLRACVLIPATQTGFAGGVPITTAVTGGAAAFWQGPPVKFKVANDTFYPVTAATVAAGGTGYAIGDIITLASAPNTSSPIGAPAQLQVLTLSGSAVATVSVIPVVTGGDEIIGGSYFQPQANPVAQGTTTGSGSGATFNLTFGPAASQRVILTNQEFATMSYVMDVIDPNIMDDQFQDAWGKVLGASVCIPLTGDKKLANLAIGSANALIERVRVGDGVEALTVNDVTPDWMRIRGVDFPEPYGGPWTGFDWGGMWPIFG